MPASMPTKVQLAYAAGIIDGEGCIRINRQKTQKAVLRVHVTNTDKRLIDLLKEWFGGYVWTESKSYMPNAKRRYDWEVSSALAEKFILQILPYLILKREQAELALKLRALIGKPGQVVSPAIQHAKTEIFAQMTALNRKGKTYAIEAGLQP